MRHEPNILNFQNSNITKIGSENPFLQAPAMNARAESVRSHSFRLSSIKGYTFLQENVFQPPSRSFVPAENMAKSLKKMEASYDSAPKANTYVLRCNPSCTHRL